MRITAGDNLINYSGELTTKTADITTSKILWNSVLSTKDAKFMCINISNFYLAAPMERYEYMKMPLSIFPEHIIQQYDLRNKAKNGWVYLDIRHTIWGLPQAGRISNELLKKQLTSAGYYEVPHTPGLWKHVTRPIQFTLVVDDFGVKYVGKEHADHLIRAIKKDYKIPEDWEGDLYCGISLKWNYDKRWMELSIPGYTKKLLLKYKHSRTNAHHSPFPVAPVKYGKASQYATPIDKTPLVGKEGISRVQQVVGSIMYYTGGVDPMVKPGLSTLANKQTKATKKTMSNMEHMLDYLETHPDATIRYYALDMILNVHSDASYLSESKGRSRASGNFWLGSLPKDGKPIQLNVAILDLCIILKFVAVSAAEAELSALFLNVKETRILRLTLEEMVHMQPPSPIYCNNATAVRICNGTVKQQHSPSFKMRYFYVCDQVRHGYVAVYWHPGMENLGDYLSKHHITTRHIKVRPLYLHEANSPRWLPRASKHSNLEGCVGMGHGGLASGHP